MVIDQQEFTIDELNLTAVDLSNIVVSEKNSTIFILEYKSVSEWCLVGMYLRGHRSAGVYH